MSNVFSIPSTYGEQFQIAKTAKRQGNRVKVVDQTCYDDFFITNNSNNPVKINGRVFKFIFMSARPDTQFHNVMFIVCTNDKNDVRNWVD